MPKSDREHGLLPAFTFNFFTCPIPLNTGQQKNVNVIPKKQIIGVVPQPSRGIYLLDGMRVAKLWLFQTDFGSVYSDGSDCVCTCTIISLCLKCWFTHTDPLYRISKQWRRGHYHSLQQDTFWHEDNKMGYDVSKCKTKSLKIHLMTLIQIWIWVVNLLSDMLHFI